MCENVRESMNYGKKEATKNKKKEKKGDNRTCKLLYIVQNCRGSWRLWEKKKH